MTTPYWGQLPGPRTAAFQPNQTSSSRARRSSNPSDYSPTADRRPSLDAAGRPNRVSVQTTNTDAPTESTFSPYASPTASDFRDRGLAPRPPTFPYGDNQYPDESLTVSRRRRRPQQQHQPPELDDEDDGEDLDDPAAFPPPAAPDVPRAPPVSFRHPYGNGALPFTIPTPAAIPRSAARGLELYSPSADMDPEEYYKSAPVPANTRRRSSGGGDMDAAGQRRSSGAHAASGRPRDVRSSTDPAIQGRKASTASQAERQRKLADDRSPLQRLELTLDSITKEEKRARVEAAEQQARERDADRPANQQVRFREAGPDAQRGPAIAAHRGPLSQNPPEGGQRYGSVSGKASKGDSKIPVPQASGIPQRNLSFRERAERNDLNLPRANGNGNDSPTSPPAGISLTRSGSNKLKKEPPLEGRYRRQPEPERVERKYPAAQARNGPSPEPPEAEIPPIRAPGRGSVRVKPPPPETARAGPVLEAPAPPREATIRPPRPPAAKLSKSPSQRKPVPQQVPRSVPPPQVERRDTGGERPKPSQLAPIATAAAAGTAIAAASAVPTARAARHRDDDDSSTDDGEGFAQHGHNVSRLVYRARDKLKPGEGMYKPPQYLDEWKKATVGTLSGVLLDLGEEVPPPNATKEQQAWWETPPSQRRGSMPRPMKAEAFDGEYDETSGPTRFKPPLYLRCGPLLRLCGTRTEKAPARSTRNGATTEREIWRGSVMIVTQDAESAYDIAPTLRMFLQPIELLPPPPAEIQGPLPPEYVDPIAGHPKLGRRGETLYVRPIEHIEEATDLSRDETDEGLYEKTRSPLDEGPRDGATDPHGSFSARRNRIRLDGEKVTKYKDIRGFRLHAERGLTFWRFNLEVELRDKQQRIAYRINRGPSTGFWVPARGQAMNIMFHSCNGFSLSVEPDHLSGPDPLWRDVLNTHQTQPFHVMIGGGDQVYNDAVIGQTKIFQEWLMIKNTLSKHNSPFTVDMQNELENFYLERYCMWFSQGLFALANSQIPMVNMYDDHDIIDGFGSYPHHFMNSPVFSGLGNVAFKYYMLFQHQSVPDETQETEPSWMLGPRRGPYINEFSRSLFMKLGGGVALLAVDCRTERKRDEVIREDTWKKIMDRCYAEVVKGKTEHLLVLLGVPIAYPRLVWLENILTSRLMDPIKALGRMGVFGKLLNRFDGGVEILDDLDDHWTAKDHKDERRVVIEDLQDLAADKSVRITILSGDVHLAAVGQFYSKLSIAKHKDFRYMPNVVCSAIVNTPPPDLMADVLNKRNKVHHFDEETDENMIPLFSHGVEGKPRNNKHLLPHRNWCSIRPYVPGNTPHQTPDISAHDLTPLGSPPGSKPGLLRRLSMTHRTQTGPTLRPDGVSRPPISGSGSFMRGRASIDASGARPPPPKRTLSLTRGDFKPGNLFRRLSGRRRPDDHARPGSSRAPADDGGINGQWGPDSDEDYYDDEEEDLPPAAAKRLGIPGRPPQRRGKAPDPYPIDGPEDEEEDLPPAAAKRLGLPARAPRRRGKAPDPYPLDDHDSAASPPPDVQRMGIRGGGGSYAEFEDGDDSYFTAQPAGSRRAAAAAATADVSTPGGSAPEDPGARPFHRTPTGLSARQLRRAETVRELEVNLEGGLDVTLNVEVNPKDPAGITVPYRLVVPRLWYTYQGEEAFAGGEEGVGGGKGGGRLAGIKRWISIGGGRRGVEERERGGYEEGEGTEEDEGEEYYEEEEGGVERAGGARRA